MICYSMKNFITIVMLLFPSPLNPLCRCSHFNIHPSTPSRRPIYPNSSFLWCPSIVVYFPLSTNHLMSPEAKKKLISCNLILLFFSLSPRLVNFQFFSTINDCLQFFLFLSTFLAPEFDNPWHFSSFINSFSRKKMICFFSSRISWAFTFNETLTSYSFSSFFISEIFAFLGNTSAILNMSSEMKFSPPVAAKIAPLPAAAANTSSCSCEWEIVRFLSPSAFKFRHIIHSHQIYVSAGGHKKVCLLYLCHDNCQASLWACSSKFLMDLWIIEACFCRWHSPN